VDTQLEAVIHTAEPLFSELQGERELFSPKRTLGYFALKANAQHALQSVEFTTSSGTQTQQNALNKELRRLHHSKIDELRKARETLTMYEGEKQQTIEQYITNIAPDELVAAKQSVEDAFGVPISWKQWIEYNASDDQLMHLLLQHTSVMLEHTNSEAILDDIEKFEKQFVQVTRRLYEEDTLAAVPKDTSEVSLRFGDVFDTALHNQVAYYEMDEKVIVVGQGYRGQRNNFVAEARQALPLIVWHEWAHALIGHSFREDADHPLVTRWLNEGITEELAQLIARGDGGEVAKDDTYGNERRLISDIISPSRHPVEIRKQLFRAYSGTVDDQAIFMEEVDALWGTKDVMKKISNEVLQKEKILANDKPIDGFIQTKATRLVRGDFARDPRKILS
jgi:hypothetical protein